MPECTFHRGVETNVRCVECERPICPKDFVPTPVGYKCPDCARQLPSARRVVKPRQLALAALAAVGVGLVGGFVMMMLAYGSWLLTAALGLLAGGAARRASGGHRQGAVVAAAGLGAAIGIALSGAGPLLALIGAAAAATSISSGRW